MFASYPLAISRPGFPLAAHFYGPSSFRQSGFGLAHQIGNSLHQVDLGSALDRNFWKMFEKREDSLEAFFAVAVGRLSQCEWK